MHVAIIPDGNRRWAKAQGLKPWKGHEKSAETFESLINWCREDGRVKVLTMWIFSTENWKRDEIEVQKLMKMFEKYLQKEEQTLHKNKTRLMHSGRKDRLHKGLLETFTRIIEDTAKYDDFILNIALDYGGKDEVLRAINNIPSNELPLQDSASLDVYMDNPDMPEIDLIIRTSGEKRTSNFFLWQSAYAEWIFSDVLFPDFSTLHMKKAIDEYETRSRRFGS